MSELITTYEYCTTCKKKHTMLDGGDIYDCWIQHRKDNPKDTICQKPVEKLIIARIRHDRQIGFKRVLLAHVDVIFGCNFRLRSCIEVSWSGYS